MKHIPVLLKEAVENLTPTEGKTYIDATFGGGSYTRAILEKTNCNIISFDRDPSVIQTAEDFKKEFGDRFTFVHDKFSNISQYVSKIDGIVADFGISSMHVDNTDRGFSFNREAKLNMQMGKCEISAFDVINTFTEKKLEEIIWKYSNERLSKKIAEMIFHARKKKEINTTTELAAIIFEAYNKPQHYKIHPATKTFQAIRIFVNNELEEIEILLNSSMNLLQNTGRIVCVSFHELEDRIVKNFFNDHSQKKEKRNKYAIENISDSTIVPFKVITQKPIEPSVNEIKNNPRSRSAKLRCAEKI